MNIPIDPDQVITRTDILSVVIASAVGGIASVAASITDQQHRSVREHLARGFVGAAFGLGTGAIALSYDVSPLFAVGVSSILGSFGWPIYIAIGATIKQVTKDPFGFWKKAKGEE
jgi:hypothetical protein